MGRGAALAIAAHALLIGLLAVGARWHVDNEPEGVEAELWSATPQIAAPKATDPPPPPPPPPPPAPVRPREVAPPPPPVPKPQVDPQIAIEQAKKEREEKKRDELLARQEQQKRQKQLDAQAAEDAKKLAAKKEQAKEQAEKLAQQKQDADAKKQKQLDDAKAAKIRQDTLKRMMGMADATGDATATGNATRTSGPSSNYAGRIKARVRPNMTFADTLEGDPAVEVTITVAPDGTITSERVTKASGAPEFDAAVIRALQKTAILPRDESGRVFSPMTIVWKLRDLKP